MEGKPTGEQVPNTGPDSGPDDIVQEVLDTIAPLMAKGASEEEWDRVLKQQRAKLQGAKDRPARILEEAISAALKEGKKPEL